MKHKIILIVIIMSVMVLPACSVRHDFVVVNESGHSIEVQYQFKPSTSQTAPLADSIQPPAKLGIKEFQKAGREWKEATEEQFHYDNRTGVVTVQVAPDEVLLLDYVYNYSEFSFDLASLSLTGAQGSIRLEGRQTFKQFREESGSFVIRYQ
ncbi:MAG: hypothetical protein U0401_05775 [Anaerolineae bacterium]